MSVPTADALSNDEVERIDMFDLAPVSLSLEDYSRLHVLFDQWRDSGVIDLRAHLKADASRVVQALECVRLIRVNRRALELFGAASTEDMIANIHLILRDDMRERYVEELIQLWNGVERFTSQTINYSIAGDRLDVVLSTQILPQHRTAWDRVLVSIEDATERMESQRSLARSEAHARTLFEHSPVSLWVEDYRAVKHMLDAVRASGVTDLGAYMQAEPTFVLQCIRAVRMQDVNRRTLDMFGAPDRQTLFDNLSSVLGEWTEAPFAEHLLELWEGRIYQQREVVNRSLSGARLDVYLQFAVQPGFEHDWGQVLVSLIDITARKQAESDLEYLGTHDSLTGLHNRSFFAAELKRIERTGPWPITLMILDLNGLKPVNDQHGHAAGDALIRRAGQVLAAAGGARAQAARIGGDEFALWMQGTGQARETETLDSGDSSADLLQRAVLDRVEIDNRLHDGPSLSFSIGCATAAADESTDAALHLADQRMYANKRAYYRKHGINRRGETQFD